jgi:hypothetical protein
MNELRDCLHELAEGYASTSRAPGPGAARRRGRWRRRRTVGGLVLAGLLVIAASFVLVPALGGRQTPNPIAPSPGPAPLQVPRSTAWFQVTYLPGGLQLVEQSEEPAWRLGPLIQGAQSFRLVKGDGEFTVSVHPDLQRLEVARELDTYPTVRLVSVRGHQGLLFPYRPDNHYNGVIWEERPGVVVQVFGRQGVPDQRLLDVAAGLRITETPGGTVAITVGPRPPGWIKVGRGTALGDSVTVLPRSHQQLFNQARRGADAELMITRRAVNTDRCGRLTSANSSRRPAGKPSPCTATRPCSTTIRSTTSWRLPGVNPAGSS